jgi:hypothetical protein
MGKEPITLELHFLHLSYQKRLSLFTPYPALGVSPVKYFLTITLYGVAVSDGLGMAVAACGVRVSSAKSGRLLISPSPARYFK